ncbi:MAG TPA: SBBP repeat-containing protein [Candidatus Angelobacter sp.]|jgi:hypothetical protein|nr:SBBP repeat-containing protein [Candidatus Angelobacter sp.]
MANGYAKLPLSFEPNLGQSSSRVRFLSHGSGYTLFLTTEEAVLSFISSGSGTYRKASSVRLCLAGARPEPQLTAEDALPGRSNYFIGNDPARWRKDIPQYSRVRYHDVYPGIDLVYYGNQGRLEYDFVVHPGADPKKIALRTEDSGRVQIDSNGDLLLAAGDHGVRWKKPTIYQTIAGQKKLIAGRYVMRSGRLGFRLGAYDPTRDLVIDPVLDYSTFLGQVGSGSARSIAVDRFGNAYVTGDTNNDTFPTKNPIQAQPTPGNFFAIFIAKLNPEGTALVYSTYLSGSQLDSGRGIAVNSQAEAYITGLTLSPDFPTKNAVQPVKNSTDPFAFSAFVTKLNASGNELVYSTYLGGSGSDDAEGIAVDREGNAYITGSASSTDFPVVNAFQNSLRGGQFDVDAFVTKLNPSGRKIIYSTYLGGTRGDSASAIAVDELGEAYVTGSTSSTDFPVQNAIQPQNAGGNSDVFVTKLNARGDGLIYSTYMGGAKNETGNAIAVDERGAAYVTGSTTSADFPTSQPIQSFNLGQPCAPPQPLRHFACVDGFVFKIGPAGDRLDYSTFLGGTDTDSGSAIAVDESGNAYVTGGTQSADFPVRQPLQAFNLGHNPNACGSPQISGPCEDVFVTKIDREGTTLVYSTFLGGSSRDFPGSVAVDRRGSAYVFGSTFSSDFVTTPRAFEPTPPGPAGTSNFLTKISDEKSEHGSDDHNER